MIPLTTGIISVYFALLKFLGTEDIHPVTFDYGYLVPPILFLISLVTFIVASFLVPMRLPNSCLCYFEFVRIYLYPYESSSKLNCGSSSSIQSLVKIGFGHNILWVHMSDMGFARWSLFEITSCYFKSKVSLPGLENHKIFM